MRTGRLRDHLQAEVLPGATGRHATTGCAIQKALVDEEGLDDIFERALVLANGRGEGLEPNGAPVELLDDGQQNGAVQAVESGGVDIQPLEGKLGLAAPHATRPTRPTRLGAGHLCEIADPAKQPICDPRGAARARGGDALGSKGE